jgi:eukaryotic-like serine/threonine-protein kinase
MSISICPSSTELEDLIAGRLDAQRHRTLGVHIESCRPCQAVIEALDEPQDAFFAAVGELVGLAVSSEKASFVQEVDRLRSLPPNHGLRTSSHDHVLPSDGTLGDFRILRQVGRGGMGIVYEARQILLDRTVALKTLPFAALLDPRRLQRFQNEARAAASLEHPHIVPVYAVGSDRGVHFYAMRFIDGPNLAQTIEQLRNRSSIPCETPPGAKTATLPRLPMPNGVELNLPEEKSGAAHEREPRKNGSDGSPQNKRTLHREAAVQPAVAQGTASLAAESTIRVASPVGPLAEPQPLGPQYIDRVVRLAIEAARALDYAHERGVVHRDIKPSNLMLDANGVLWITDFGLARIEADPTFSATGEVIGTLRYMSPEQALGKRGVVDHRSDIYSLGVTLYELLTLTPIFPDLPDPVVLAKIATEDPAPPRRLNPSIPVDLETIVQKAMSKEAAERYATATDFAADLEHFRNHQRIKAQRPGVADRLARWLRRHPAGLPVVATAVVALVMMAAGFATYSAVLSRTIRERDESNTRLNTANLETANALRQSKQAGARADRALQASREHIYAQDIERALDALGAKDISLASNLLDRHVPQNGQSDLRGFEWYWLSNGLHRTARILRVSQKPVYDAEYSPDGGRIATGGADADLSVFDAKSGARILRVPTGQIEINSVAFSPDGQSIATTGDDGTIRVWDAGNGKPRLRMTGPKGRHTFSVLFTPDGRQLVTTSNEHFIRFWNARTGDLEVEIEDADDDVNQIALSADGKTLASANDDGKARLYDLPPRRGLKPRRVLPANEGRCLALSFSHDGKLLVTGHDDRTIRIWKCADGSTVVPGHLRDPLHDVCFLPSGEGVLAADGVGTVRMWAIPKEFDPAPPPGRAAFSSISRGRSDDSVARWKRHVGAIHHLAIDRLGKSVASAGNDGTVSLTDLFSGARGPRMDWQAPSPCSQFRFGPHDEFLWTDRATVGDGYTPGGNVSLLNLETKTEKHWDKSVANGLSGFVMTPDGSELLTGHELGKIQIHRRHSSEPAGNWDLKATSYVDQLEFLSDGRTLVVRLEPGSDDLRFYDYPTRKRLDRYPTRPIREALVVSRSGRWLAANGDRVGYVWDLRAPAFSLHEFASPDNILALAVSPDDRLLASAGVDRKIALRSLPTGAIQSELIGHEAFVTSVAFSPDGRTLISGDLCGNIKIWSVVTGRLLFDLLNVPTKIERIEFSPSGRYLAYSAYHGPVVIFDLQRLKTDG